MKVKGLHDKEKENSHRLSRLEILILFLLGLSILSPIIIAPLNLFQIVSWPLFLVLMASVLLQTRLSRSYLFVPLLLFTASIIISILVNFLIAPGPARPPMPAVGGIESYLQIVSAWVFAALTFDKVRFQKLEKFIVFLICPILAFTILLFLLNPQYVKSTINLYSFGVSDTGQWRFSGFFGLPYYAGVAYSVCMLFILRFFHTETLNSIRRLALVSVFLILFVGGMLAASKTFFAGLAMILLYFFLILKVPAVKKIGFLFVIFVFAFFTYFSLLRSFLNLDAFSKIIDLAIANLLNPLGSLYFRYSSSNDAVSSLFRDDYWSFFFGVGLNAEALATDSQWRDLSYRFGFFGVVQFFIFLLFVYWRSDKFFRVVLLVLFIGSLGSNAFTSINFNFFIWYAIFLNAFQKRYSRSVIKLNAMRLENVSMVGLH